MSGKFPANTWNITSLWLLFVLSLFLVVTLGRLTPKRICTHNGSKRVKSAKDVPFGGLVKMVTPLPTSPQILKILHYKSRFSLKTRINLGGSSTRIRIRIGNSPWRFQIWGWKFDRKYNSGHLCACAAENWLKIFKIFRHEGNRSRWSQILGRILHRK